MTADTVPLRRAWLALAALSLGFFMTLLDQSTVAVALPTIARDFDVSYATAAWASSAYLLAVVVPLPVTGRMGDSFGHRRMFLIGIALFTAAATASALAPTIVFLVLARFVQGLGAALLMPQTMAVINQVFPRERRGTAFGAWGVVGALAGLVGPVAGGVLIDVGGWRAIFWLHLPLGIVALLLASRWVPVLPKHATSMDLVSVGLSLVSLAAIVVAIQEGLDRPVLWAAAVLGLVVGAVFVLRQRRADALIPLRLFESRNFSVGIVTIVVMGVIASSMLIPLMAWLQDDLGIRPSQSGWVAAPMAVVGFVMGPVCGVLSDRVAPKLMHVVGFGLLALSLGGLAAVVQMGGSVWLAVAGVTLYGFGQAFIWAANAAAVLGDIPGADMGAASGAYNTSRQLGGVIGVACTGIILAAAGAALALVMLTVVVVVGLFAATFFQPVSHPK